LSLSEGGIGTWYVSLMSWLRLACRVCAASQRDEREEERRGRRSSRRTSASFQPSDMPSTRLRSRTSSSSSAALGLSPDALLTMSVPPSICSMICCREGVSTSAAGSRRRRGRGTHLCEAAVDERLDAVVPDHVVAEADLDHLVLGDRRRDGVEEVGERAQRRRLEVFACEHGSKRQGWSGEAEEEGEATRRAGRGERPWRTT